MKKHNTGIAAADLQRVQEPFFTTKSGGTGLGLSVCRSVVWGMGGRLELYRQEKPYREPGRPAQNGAQGH